ncbi:MAG: urease accessory protein UreE [Pseudomonadota bacterium]
MLEFSEIVADAQTLDGVVELPFALRQKSRFRCALPDGTDVGVFLQRGTILRHGDCLTGGHGQVIRVDAKSETVSRVSHQSTLLLSRAAYHLGNRHVALQLGDGWLQYLHDHVLDDMCRQMGLKVTQQSEPFEPESGAYHGGHHHG